MKKSTCLALCLLSAIMGAAATHLYQTGKQLPVRSRWIDIKDVPVKGDGSGLQYTTDALFDADISLPDIKKLDFKLKFTIPTDAGLAKFRLGYVATIDVESLDTTKVPEQYRREEREMYKVGPVTTPPLEQVVYTVHLEFTLQDKDGFNLMQLSGPPHALVSGKTNNFQDVTKELVPREIVDRTFKIKPLVQSGAYIELTRARLF